MKTIKELEKEIEEMIETEIRVNESYFKTSGFDIRNWRDISMRYLEERDYYIQQKKILKQTKEICELIEEHLKNYKELFYKLKKTDLGVESLAQWEAMVLLLLKIKGEFEDK